VLSRLRQAESLSLSEWVVLAQLIIGAWLLRMRLRVVPLHSVVRNMAAVRGRARWHPFGQQWCDEMRLARLCDIAGGVGFESGRCLIASLLLVRLLAVRGATSQLCLGIRTDGPAFPTHAWVERDGRPADATDPRPFTILARL
jgi:Transglutaminase-like superfamily